MNRLNITLIGVCAVLFGAVIVGVILCANASCDISEKNEVVGNIMNDMQYSLRIDGVDTADNSASSESILAKTAATAFDKTTDGKTFRFGHDVWNIKYREWQK